jgi:hypothetical protein
MGVLSEFQASICPLKVSVFVSGSHGVNDQGIEWTGIVQLELAPRSEQARAEITEMDYGMRDGGLRMNLRASAVGYILHKWSLDCSPDHSLRGHDCRPWLKDRLAICGVRSAVLGPGFAQTNAKASIDD